MTKATFRVFLAKTRGRVRAARALPRKRGKVVKISVRRSGTIVIEIPAEL